MNAAWLCLIVAGFFEIGWPIGLKNGYGPEAIKWPWIGFAILCMGLSGALLFLAQRSIPIGTAYAVWTGIGAAGTFAVGVVFFGDAMSLLRMMSALLIIAGVIGLKLAS